MELSNVFLSSLNVKTDMNSQPTTASKADSSKPNFGNYLDKSRAQESGRRRDVEESNHDSRQLRNEKDKPVERKRDDSKESRDVRTKEKSVDKEANTENVNAKEGTNEQKVEDSKDDSKVNEMDTTKKTITNVKETDTDDIQVSDLSLLTEESRQKLIEQLAQELGVPMEQIQQILQTMKIEPNEILKDGNLNQFVMQLKSIEDPMDVLKLPDMKEIIEAVKNALENTEFEHKGMSTDTEMMALDIMDEQEIDSPVTKNEAVTKPVKQNETTVTNTEDSDAVVSVSDAVETASSIGTDGGNGQEYQSKGNQLSQNVQSGAQISNNTNHADDVQFSVNGVNTSNSNVSEAVKAQAASTTQRANAANIINQLTEQIKINYKPDGTEMKMVLRPESLGEVSLRLLTTNGVISAQFIAESQQVKEAIEQNFEVLKNMLTEQGLSISELSVTVEQRNKEQMEGFEFGQKKSEKRIRDILNGISSEIDDDTIDASGSYYVNSQDVSTSQVDYTA